MTKTLIIESVAKREDLDTEDIFRNDYESFVEEQLALADPAVSVKIGPSRQLTSRTFDPRQESFEGRQSSDSTGLRTMKKWSSTTSLASVSTATSSPNSSPRSVYRGEELSSGRCQSGRTSIETSLSRSNTMFENPLIGLSNEDEGGESFSFAEWALTAHKRCRDARFEPVAPRPVARLWLHKLIDSPSDNREVRALSPVLPSASSPRKHKHWMLKACLLA